MGVPWPRRSWRIRSPKLRAAEAAAFRRRRWHPRSLIFCTDWINCGKKRSRLVFPTKFDCGAIIYNSIDDDDRLFELEYMDGPLTINLNMHDKWICGGREAKLYLRSRVTMNGKTIVDTDINIAEDVTDMLPRSLEMSSAAATTTSAAAAIAVKKAAIGSTPTTATLPAKTAHTADRAVASPPAASRTKVFLSPCSPCHLNPWLMNSTKGFKWRP
jgi:hypothetical protein